MNEQIKLEIFQRFISLGLDTVKRYTKFLTDAPEDEMDLRMFILTSISGSVPDEVLEECLLFLK